ncbi:MAG: GNAT family N-acetyltransferase [Pseudomonadota bacterium]
MRLVSKSRAAHSQTNGMTVTAERHIVPAPSSGMARDAMSELARDAAAEHAATWQPFALENGARIELRISHTLDAAGLAMIATLREGPPRTLFSSPEWIEAWLGRGDLARAGTPVLIFARDDEGVPAFVLPLFLRRTGGASVLTWLGEETFAVQFPPCAKAMREALTSSDIERLFAMLRSLLDGGFDAVRLRNQPKNWAGASNPFAAGANDAAPNGNFERALESDYAALYESTFTSRERRNHARQRRRLHEAGSIDVSIAETDAEREEILAAFFAFKTAQLEQIGAANPFACSELRTFYRRGLASLPQTPTMGPVCAGLRVDGVLVATLLGVRDGERFTTLMSAITLDDVARTSPGQQLLEHVMADLCARDVRVFDFGPGASQQKLRWNMAPVTLYDRTYIFHPRAWPVVLWGRATSGLVRRLKNNPTLFRTLSSLRARVMGRSRPKT